MSPRTCALSFQINSSSILIAGGYKNDCYILDTKYTDYAGNNSLKYLKKASNLPERNEFQSPSTVRIGSNHIYALGGNLDIYKYTITEDKWKKENKFEYGKDD